MPSSLRVCQKMCMHNQLQSMPSVGISPSGLNKKMKPATKTRNHPSLATNQKHHNSPPLVYRSDEGKKHKRNNNTEHTPCALVTKTPRRRNLI